MQPKSLLRLPAAASSLEDLTAQGFQTVIDDPAVADHRDDVRRLVFCTGKIYYDLVAEQHAAQVAVVRVEELYPWPQAVGALVDKYPNVDEVVWAQEEPKNMGAWTYVAPRLRADIGTIVTLRYIGRPERASPAEGYHNEHMVEQSRIVTDALTLKPASGRRKANTSARSA
jgi:2-oxoglutarate dehydrogenase E1 component